jgi:glycerol-3-phosphate acyltransferase PlsY
VTRIASLGSLAATLIGGVAMVIWTAVAPLPPIYFVYGVGVPGLIWLFHADNIQRLLSGQERRLGGPGKSGPSAGQPAGGSR